MNNVNTIHWYAIRFKMTIYRKDKNKQDIAYFYYDGKNENGRHSVSPCSSPMGCIDTAYKFYSLNELYKFINNESDLFNSLYIGEHVGGKMELEIVERTETTIIHSIEKINKGE